MDQNPFSTPFDGDSLTRALEANTNAILRLVECFEAFKRGEPVYNNKQAAKLLGRCEETIASYVKQGRLKRVASGDRFGIPQSEIDRELSLRD